MSNFFKLASTAVIYELLDKEVIIANLDTGIYYSLRGTSVPLWQLLLAHYDRPQVIDFFAQQYPASDSSSPNAIAPDLNAFIQKLLEENLLIEAEAEAVSPDLQRGEIDIKSLLWPAVFASPVLERYDEMTQLLMLDPIHEVDEQGWPHELTVS